jgi:hypothetical protein
MRSAVIRIRVLVSLLLVYHGLPLLGQQSAAAANLIVPPLVQFSGVLTDLDGKPLSGVVGVTFCLYKDSQGGAPLWMETQNVQTNKAGHYSVMLGSTTSLGLPVDLFASGTAHWLGVQPQGQREQPRVLLLSVPYALKAGDAETVGGLPPSAFVLATPNAGGAISGVTNGSASSASTTSAPSTSSNVTTTGGTVSAVPLWTTATNIQSSVLTQTGTGSTAKIGINTNTPAATLDVKGSTNVEGALTLPATGAASATAGKNSQPQGFVASSFNSSTSKATAQTFQWQAEPASNDTASPSGTLNLLFGSGTNKRTETGLQIASNGQITFASGQTFPGTGTGTITGVAAGTGLTGGGTSGSITLNLDTTKIPQLGTSNTFTGNQTVNGNLTVANNSTYQPFQVQSSSTFGTWLELSNTSAGGQTWNILSAGAANSEGAGNLGITNLHGGTIFLEGPVNATGNAVIGGLLGVGIPAPQYPLHVSGTIRSENGLSLGGTAPVAVDAPGVAGGRFSVLSNGTVGIGTAAPRSILEASVYAPAAMGPALTLTNSGTGHPGAASALDFNSYAPSSSGTYNPTARIAAVDANNYSNDIVFSSNQPGAANNGLQEHMRITSTGGVSINGDTPMSHNPHMSFSGTWVGSLCNNVNCGGFSSGSLWGAFIPDYNIVITRVMGTLNSRIDPSCLPANISIQAPNNQTYGTVSLPANDSYFDSGPISITVPGGQFVELYPRIWGGCNFGASAGGDLYMNAQYVMQ